jgi:hypothetical protein
MKYQTKSEKYYVDQKKAELYDQVRHIFDSLIQEVRELSKKKPEATLSKKKVEIINRVLTDALEILKGQPDAKYLETLDDEALPQHADAVLIMTQIEAALNRFYGAYTEYSQWNLQGDEGDEPREDEDSQ